MSTAKSAALAALIVGIAGPALAAMENPYPAPARALNLPGKATLSCKAASDGAVHDCSVTSEQPTGWGFGAAAKKAAPLVNVGPGAADRAVQVPVAFNLDKDEAKASPVLEQPGFSIPENLVTWEARPSAREFALAYPERAVEKGGPAGTAEIGCRVDTDGRLPACVVISETPADLGFGRAAIALGEFQMSTALADGRSVSNGVIKLTVHWDSQN